MARANRPRPARTPQDGAAGLAALEHVEAMTRAQRLHAAAEHGEAARLAHAVLKRDPNHAGALHLLGRVALDTGAWDIAAGMLSRALAQMPKSPAILVDYAQAMAAAGRHADSVSAYRKAVALRPRDPDIHCALGDTLLDLDKRADALAAYRTALRLDPGHQLAAHMVARLTGAGDSAAYVATLFDTYAGNFDAHLTGKLGYRVPELMAEAVARHAQGEMTSALDLGCGTGLVAAALAGRARDIDGIDLSPAMIEAARKKALYRHLAAADIVAALKGDARFAGPYDLVLAGDVFVYVGDLAPVFAAVRAVLAPDGLFVFTVEHAEGADAVLRSSGRTAHGAAHVERLAAATGFVARETRETVLRKERGRPIAGRLHVLAASTNAGAAT